MLQRNLNETDANNKRIVRNTIILYVRMFLVMGVSLYTSRVILKNLGVTDFGIYNVVGSIVAMMSVVNSSMAMATQRYITFALGKNDYSYLNKVFSTSILIYIFMSILFSILAETVGLWWLNEKMIIPENRLIAANWVYQFSIVGCIFTLMINPFNATIIAYEKMDYYAYLSIVEVIMKLGIAILLSILPYDRLSTFGCLMCIVSIVILLLYYTYCKRNFKECRFRLPKNNSLFRELLCYSGWNILAAFSVVAKGQGLNIMLNAFFGPTVNAARGISYQINTVVSQFFTNFYTAVKPQVTKYYAQGNVDDMMSLIFRSAKLSFYLILIISLPIVIETPQIIHIWLDVEIDNVVIFTRIIILISAVDALATPLMTLMHSTGRIKLYQLVISVATILILPISYILIKYLHYEAVSAFWVSLTVSVFCMFARLFLVNRVIKFPIKEYIKDVYLRSLVVGCLAFIPPFFVHQVIQPSLISLILVSLIAFVSSVIVIYTIGLNEEEKILSQHYIKSKLIKITKK